VTARQYAAPKRLGFNVFTAPAKAVVGERPRPFGEPLGWDPITATLIYGEYDAVLVDTLATVAEAEALADWVALHHRNLTTIYVTHGHFDHFFGLSVLLDRFPGAHAIATPKSVELMHEQVQTATSDYFLRRWWPGQLPAQPLMAEPYPDRTSPSRATNCALSSKAAPTRCIPRRCMFPPSTSLSAATCSTTNATCTSGTRHPRAGAIGSRR
jgi:hypothetical protein